MYSYSGNNNFYNINMLLFGALLDIYNWKTVVVCLRYGFSRVSKAKVIYYGNNQKTQKYSKTNQKC